MNADISAKPFEKGRELDPPMVEFDYKNDEHRDSMLDEDIAVAPGAATMKDLKEMGRLTLVVTRSSGTS